MSGTHGVIYKRLIGRARLRHLELLVAVVDQGAVKRAAEQVGMSQPAATQAIAELERLLGVTLFERQARGMKLSNAGQLLMPTVRRALAALEASLEAMLAVQAGASGLLRVGTIPAAAVSMAGNALRILSHRHPSLQIVVQEGTPTRLLEELTSGGLDAVLTRQPTRLCERFRFVRLGTDEAIVIAGPGHPLATRARVKFDDLLNYPWLRPPANVRVRDLFDELFETRPLPPMHPVATTSPTVILQVLADNRTVVLGPASAATWYIQLGLAVQLKLDARFPIPGLGVVYPASAVNEPVTAALLDALRDATVGNGG